MRGVFRPVSHSLGGLDRKVLAHIGRNGGIFVEAGAYDGVTQSNTWLLERHYGWRGLLVEPIPDYARLCAKFRPRSIVRNCALGAFSDRGKAVEMLVGGLMSTVNRPCLAGVDPGKHAMAGQAFTGGSSPASLSVETRPLSDLLDDAGIDHVDFLSLDVEGDEIAVLGGIDFSRHKIDYILIETRDLAAVERVLPNHALDGPLSHHDYLFVRAPKSS